MSNERRLNIINRDSYKKFLNSPIIDFKMDRHITAVRMKMVDHDAKYKKLKEQGLQIDITNSEILVNNKRPIDGIFSPLFGADTTTESVAIYSCDCHKLTGGSNLGRICPECNTRCRSIETDLTLCGYIDIAPYHVLTFHGWTQFCKIFKESVMKDIITSVKRINVKGKIIDDGKPTIMSLYNDYEDKYEDLIGLHKKYIFTTKIPVYTARLRPLMRTGVKMTILDVNKRYLSIINSRNILTATPIMKLQRGIEVQRTLNQIQQDLNEIFNHVQEQLNEKKGTIRKSLIAGRVDYSARLVIALGTDLQPHEIDVPYSLMMTLYEEEIANYLSRLEGISLDKAINIVSENSVYKNEKLVKIINQFLKARNGVWAIINRNPTISESSILYVRIRKIHDDPTDVTMHMPPDILALLAADFDGDQLTLIACKDSMFHKYFLTMCPTYTFIDRANGKFNGAMDFKREYSALVAAGWEIDQAYDKYLKDPDENSYDQLVKLGLVDYNEDKNTIKQRNELISYVVQNLNKKHLFRKRFINDTLDAAYDLYKGMWD